MTNAIWPCVSTAALGRPVVPEVKKNQQGSSCSTAAVGRLSAAVCSDQGVDIGVAELRCPPKTDDRNVRRGLPHRRRVLREIGVAQNSAAPESWAR